MQIATFQGARKSKVVPSCRTKTGISVQMMGTSGLMGGINWPPSPRLLNSYRSEARDCRGGWICHLKVRNGKDNLGRGELDSISTLIRLASKMTKYLVIPWGLLIMKRAELSSTRLAKKSQSFRSWHIYGSWQWVKQVVVNTKNPSLYFMSDRIRLKLVGCSYDLSIHMHV